MFKCPACKNKTITWKQKYISAWGKEITCPKCDSHLFISLRYWEFMTVFLLYIPLQYLIWFRNELELHIAQAILAIAIIYFIRLFFVSLSVKCQHAKTDIDKENYFLNMRIILILGGLLLGVILLNLLLKTIKENKGYGTIISFGVLVTISVLYLLYKRRKTSIK